MDKAEFDKFADEYRQLHAKNIKMSGESPEFFAEYKVRDISALLADADYRQGGLAVLDFGAGIGTSVPYFRKYFPGCRVTCLDVSNRSLEIGRSRYPGEADFVSFDGQQIPFEAHRFDLVFAACVFHHIPREEHVRLLREVRRVLKPGRRLVIFEHNPYNPLTLHAVHTCPFDENAVLLRARDCQQRLREAGFETIARRYRLFFPGPLRVLRPVEDYLSWLPLGAQYLVTGEKGA